jgi:adenylate cyclase
MPKADDAALKELRSAESRAERLSAALRAVIFLVLLTVFASIEVGHSHEIFATLSLSLYGGVTVASLVLAWHRLFHPALAYGLVTVDVVLVAVHLVLLVRVLALPHAVAYAVPATGLIYLVLAHAALRFRPALVLYAAALFIAVLEGSRLVLPGGEAAGFEAADAAHQPFLYQHALPLAVIALTALALWMAGTQTRRMLARAIQQARRAANLSRFFSPALAERLAATEPAGATGDRRPVAILFVDMRGFSLLGRTLEPDSLAALLTEFRDVVTPPVFELEGAVDKFIGDGALILFGSLEQRADDAVRALQCGLRILEAVSAWSEHRERAGQAPVRVGVGGHFGEVFVGVLGRGSHLEFTVIGDVVNAAERIERITREVDCAFVVSEQLLRAAGEHHWSERWRALDIDSLPGHGGGVKLFAARIPAAKEAAPLGG